MTSSEAKDKIAQLEAEGAAEWQEEWRLSQRRKERSKLINELMWIVCKGDAHVNQ